MKFVFWQNIISIHQSSFLEELAKKNEVILFVEDSIEESRINEGWDIPIIKGVEVIIKPTKQKIKSYIDSNKKGVHIFSGIEAFKMPTIALKYAASLKCPYLGVLTESYNTKGIKGDLRFLKYSLLSLKYRNKLRWIFATGDAARNCFEKTLFDKRIIYDWGYFTSLSINKIPVIKPTKKDKKLNLLYVGKLNKRKNILSVIDAIHNSKSKINKFYIVGNGPLLTNFKDLILNKEYVEYLGGLNNKEVNILMNKCDLLLLPSLFDGWGAVVNEALTSGMRVLCSDECGAKSLLDENERGGSFSIKRNDFNEVFDKWLSKGRLTFVERQSIQNWVKLNISPKVVVEYFSKIIENDIKNSNHQLIAPWKK